ncbi:sulfotransferase family protein [Salinibacter ruber]|uniref:Sulfotransferase domain-containing protein n=1 Tax=Salinibacter ruber TaxID=146919 RepID=A0A9X2V7J9_9BACT|nr:sulfotransferase [Salinibacter ruber]MCS4122730.1 hypothetical protein [Salinibacter ruber]
MSDDGLPDFFLLGAAKCATTSLYCYLKQHPELHLPDHKEPHFFNDPEEEFRERLDEYRSLYLPSGSKPTCDGTPSYFRNADIVIPRMKHLYENKSPKFILIFRDPVERAFSHYLHKRRAGVVPDTFEKALKEEKQQPEKSHTVWKSYFQDGLYADRLAQWQRQFPEEHFHVLLLEDLKQDAEQALRQVFQFLDVSSKVEIDTSKQYNQNRGIRNKWVRNLMRAPSETLHSLVTTVIPTRLRKRLRQAVHEWNQRSFEEKPEMPSHVAASLRREYETSVKRLETMIDRDLSDWLPKE